MGSVGRQNVSHRARELEERMSKITKPSQRQKLVDDIMAFLNTMDMPAYRDDSDGQDRKLMQNLLRRIRRGDYGPSEE